MADVKIKGVIREIILRPQGDEVDTKGIIVKAKFMTLNNITLGDKSFGERDFGIPVTPEIKTAYKALRNLLWASIINQMGMGG